MKWMLKDLERTREWKKRRKKPSTRQNLIPQPSSCEACAQPLCHYLYPL